jgi:hypothetical protein
MQSTTIQPDATFQPKAYRQSIADMFAALDREQQMEMMDKVGMLPRYVHTLASRGMIAPPVQMKRGGRQNAGQF